MLALSSVFVFQIVYIVANWQEETKQDFIVFNVKKQTIIGQKTGKEITLFTNNNLQANSFEQKMLQSYATANFCKIKQKDSLRNVMYFKNKKILIIDKSNIYQTRLNPDIIILKDSPKLNLERYIAETKPKHIIADASNYASYVSAWKATCTKEKIPFHSTYEMGFFKL